MNLPNKLTVSRIVITPFFILFMSIDNLYARITALILFIAAALTDLFDGIIARRQKQITSFGQLIDPLADKLITSAAFVSFIGFKGLEIPIWAIVLIILREIVITDLRDFTSYKGVVIVASKAGKYKTTFQLVGVIIILMITIIKKLLSDVLVLKIPVFIDVILKIFPYYIIILIMLLTVYSGIEYILINRRILFPKNQ